MNPVSARLDTPLTAPGPAPGLSSAEAAERLERLGPNVLVPATPRPSLWSWIVTLFADPMAILLLTTAALYLALGDRLDGIIALVALAPIFLVSAVLEHRAEAALARLRDAVAPSARAYRDGRLATVPAREIVPGDVLVVHEGDVLVADGELIEGLRLTCDEATLTGESIPVEKSALGEAAERSVFAGTTVVAGRGSVHVTSTGLATRYGLIGGLLAQIESPPTPIERKIRKLMLQIGLAVAVVCIAVVAVGRAQGHEWPIALIAGVSLAMAAIPEELPMVYTLYMAFGAWRLARDRALVRRLGSVETLGATDVICVDKTGTITAGQIEVAEVVAADGDETRLLRTALLACERDSHDPLDQAIVRYAVERGVDGSLTADATLVAYEPFDPRRKYASNTWHIGERTVTARKGAPEVLLTSGSTAATLAQRSEALAGAGMRVIAVSDERSPLGLIAFADPVRPAIAESVAECRTAGIRVVMITGDHPLTARAVARIIGLAADADAVLTGDELDALDEERLARRTGTIAVFARTRPEQKLRIVRALKAAGSTVAMTGDGTNDALALREADIGIAMGQRGSEVARGAADLILLDDDFTTIVRAVRDGRRIFDNLRRAFNYLITFHIPLLTSALVIPLAGAPLLLFPVHLVVLELIVHPTSSLVFEADPAAPDTMRRPPRAASAGLLPFREWLRPALTGVTLSLGVLAVYFAELHAGAEAARAAGVVTMIVGQCIAVLTARSPDAPVWRGVAANRPLVIAVPATLASLPLAVYVPGLQTVLHFAPLEPAQWALAVGVALVATLWYEPVKAFRQ